LAVQMCVGQRQPPGHVGQFAVAVIARGRGASARFGAGPGRTRGGVVDLSEVDVFSPRRWCSSLTASWHLCWWTRAVR